MNELHFWLVLALAAAFGCAAVWLAWQRRTQRRALRDAAQQLRRILDSCSGEKVMLLTGERELIALLEQINRLLTDRQRLSVDYRRAQQSQRRMLSNISHDIRTPLTVMLGYLEIARLRGEESPALEKVETKARQVMTLTDKFFTLSKLESGDTALPLEPVNLSELCRETAVEFYELLTQQQFTVDIDIPEKDVFVRGHAESIRRILSNLISNALRYGGAGRYLGISLKTQQEQALVCVRDRGAGIAPEKLRHIFDRLYTQEDSRSSVLGGSGLGLAIAKSLAEHMGGTLSADSAPDEGAAFTLALPVRAPAQKERKS